MFALSETALSDWRDSAYSWHINGDNKLINAKSNINIWLYSKQHVRLISCSLYWSKLSIRSNYCDSLFRNYACIIPVLFIHPELSKQPDCYETLVSKTFVAYVYVSQDIIDLTIENVCVRERKRETYSLIMSLWRFDDEGFWKRP